MFQDLQAAKTVLAAEGCTCVAHKDGIFYKSSRRGVAPLMGWLEEGIDLTGFCAADKVVGKATALLYCLLGVRAVYAQVISRAALEVLELHQIPCFYDTAVAAIRNRTGDGLCPMEAATRDITDPALAPDAIRATLDRLTKGN